MQKQDREDGLLTIDEVARFFSVSKKSVKRMVEDGRCPKPIKIGGLTRWLSSEIQELVVVSKYLRDQSGTKADKRGHSGTNDETDQNETSEAKRKR